ncbi:MAG: class I SAM-dependent methyltransferase [Saprospiraceae bacterium]|nr:class I SAM-dependent methyltransferase [Saprospiraceae bacterium]
MSETSRFEMFANRLTKMQRHWGKWARRQSISCYRVYDNDIPEFPLAVDVYESILHVSEYARDHGMEPEEHAAWLDGCIETLSAVFDIHPNLIYLKFRQRQKGLRQYERFARTGAEYIVRENGLKFIINPSDYLDAGLFLDHRNTRQMVRQESGGKRVLNLFAYTGSFSVYAAAGGALETLTVDMSNTYLQWADRNLALNGLANDHNRLLQADVLSWLQQPVQEKWDLVVLDPPTFSNSKRMDGTLDVQRDHVDLLQLVFRHMAPGGVLYFSTNYRRFKLDQAAFEGLAYQDISKKTVPEDFRNKRIHQCFRFHPNPIFTQG